MSPVEATDAGSLRFDGAWRATLYAEVRAQGGASTTRTELLRGTLGALGRALDADYGALYVRLPAEVIEESYAAEATDPAFWKPPVESLLTDSLKEARPVGRLYRGQDQERLVALVSAPIVQRDGSVHGCMAFALHVDEASEAHAIQAAVESAAHLVSCCASRFDEPSRRRKAGEAAGTNLSRVAEFQSLRELAFAVTNNLRNQVSADQVTLGLTHQLGIEILAISGYDEIKGDSAGVRCLTDAMTECADAGSRIVHQHEREWSDDPVSTRHLLHQRWHQETGGAAVASLPFAMDDGRTAILSVRRTADRPFSPKELDRIHAMVEPYVPTFPFVERATRSLADHARETLAQLWHRARAPEHRTGRIVAIAAVLFAGWFCFGSLGYQVYTPARVVPAEMRQLASPFEGRLVNVAALPGDRVAAGQVLARFDHRELALERARLQAELAEQRVESGQAFSERSSLDVRLAEARARVIEARLATVEHRLEAAVLRAPFDGVVVSGDLRTRLGEQLPLGEPLFEVASTAGFRLELDVPDRAVDEIAAGFTGEFASDARPDDRVPFEIVRIHPEATSRPGATVYTVEAAGDLDAAWVRSGVEGVARIEAGGRAPWWILFHRITDYLQLHFWL